MSNRSPSILKFSTESGNQYIFDNVSGVVIPYKDEIYSTILNYDKISSIKSDIETMSSVDASDSSAYFTFVETLIQNGFFYKSNELMGSQLIDDQTLMHSSGSMLVLVVTEVCNLRCKYCVYSEHYPSLKTYSSKRMTLNVAKKAIDYYFELHSKKKQAGFRKRPMVMFYGGEPFLEINLIRQIIDYCNSKNMKPVYYLTTNGTLLNSEIIDLILSNGEDFMLTVSLDGDEEQHDRSRVFQNGQGSFDKIMKNLIKLQTEKRRRSIKQMITFNCCYDSLTDICRTVEFFTDHRELFEPFNLMFSEISSFDTTYYDCINEGQENGQKVAGSDNLTRTLNDLLGLIRDDLVKGKKPAGTLNSFCNSLLLGKNRAKAYFISSNACVPGTKLTVDPDGYYYVCERINQQYPIGDVNSKIDFERANRLIESYNNIRNEYCAACSLSRLCDVCYVHFIKGQQLEFNAEVCEAKRKSIIGLLRSIYTLLELNPKALDSLVDFTGFEVYETLIK